MYIRVFVDVLILVIFKIKFFHGLFNHFEPEVYYLSYSFQRICSNLKYHNAQPVVDRCL